MPGFVMCARHVRKLTGASPEIRCGAKIIAKIKVYIVRCRLKEDLAKISTQRTEISYKA